jgi:hypothetical protein
MQDLWKEWRLFLTPVGFSVGRMSENSPHVEAFVEMKWLN